ncbi:MAG: hypothetical protein Q8R39_02705 [bacterium]|nr:hypothetical protein [bacterium]MDZ4284510.1 hypothetical protein [Patescibacteria group bacterium]
MAPEQSNERGETPYQAPSAARALEAARMAPPRVESLVPHVRETRFETAQGPRFVIRTMQRDIEATLRREKTSLGTVVLAEERRRRARSTAGEGNEPSRIEPVEQSRRVSIATLAIVGGAVLMLGAVAVVAFVLLKPTAPQTAPGPVANAVVPVDGSVSPLTLSGLTEFVIRSRLREAVQNAKTPINTVFAIPLVDRGQLLPKEKGAILVELTTDEFFRRIAPEAPAALRRALDPAFTFGVYAFNGDTGFLAFGVQSFEIAFAEMLHWERTLSLDLGPIFRRSGSQASRASEPVLPKSSAGALEHGATTTASGIGTSTTEESLPRRTLYSGASRFEDMVVKNYDVRVFRDERGEPTILYTFPNRSTLLIAGSTATLEELIRRLTTLKRE